MHERAGDSVLPSYKKKCMWPANSQSQSSSNASAKDLPKSSFQVLPPVEKKIKEKVSKPEKPISLNHASPSNKVQLMTRRFTIAEKFQIIDKFKELNNISATTR